MLGQKGACSYKGGGDPTREGGCPRRLAPTTTHNIFELSGQFVRSNKFHVVICVIALVVWCVVFTNEVAPNMF